MKGLQEYDINFSSLKNGEHHFGYEIDGRFFTHFEPCDFECPSFHVSLSLLKSETLLEQRFSASGSLQVNCDLTGEPFLLSMAPTLHFLVKFGPEYNDDDDEVLILPYEAQQFNVAQFIYEMTVLALPQKRVHPDVENGTMQSERLELLRAMQPPSSNDKRSGETDPRWAKLKNLPNL